MPQNKYPDPQHATAGQSTRMKSGMSANPEGGGAMGQPMGGAKPVNPAHGNAGQKYAGGARKKHARGSYASDR